ncbi:MAG: hypothetical protein ABIQ39_09575 [Ilumatobacteraceae bacterium]
MTNWWQRNIVEPDKLPLLLFTLAFVVTFLVARVVTRLIRAGRGPFKNNVAATGLHVHHAVPGLVLLLTGTLLAVGAPPTTLWRSVAAVLTGIGASLVLDEFALILHLDDVYWSDEGQASVQAVSLTVMCLLAMLVGLTPFGVHDVGRTEVGVRSTGILSVIAVIAATVVCAMKGKYRLGLLAIFVPPVAIAGAIRLARPGSRWFVRHYADQPDRRLEATERATHFDAKWDPLFRRIGDLVAGRPDQ